MSLVSILYLLGGVALFLFGMSYMGDGLKRLSGDRLEPILYRLSGTPVRGVMLGAGVTAVIQSSCATSVMAVGFVNAGMMRVRQGISVVLGSILGTSITGWIICLSYLETGAGLSSLLSTVTLTSTVAVIAILLRMLAKKDAPRRIGDILMGFAILMFGMSVMSGSVEELGQQAWFTAMLTSMGNPFLAILIGVVFTVILQSASAAVGIVQALSVTGLLTMAESLPLLMGISVGASFPVLLSALDANTDARRTAMSYLTSSVIGTAVCAALFYAADAIWGFAFMDAAVDPFTLAAANTALRLVMVVLLMPFLGALEALSARLCPGRKDKAEEESVGMEERFLAHPTLALAQCRLMIADMAETAGAALEGAFALLREYRAEGFEDVSEKEEAVDRFEDTLGTYLVKLSSAPLSAKQNEDLYLLLHAITDLERISDHAFNIAENAQEIHEKGIRLSEEILHEFSVMHDALSEVLETAVKALIDGDGEAARHVEPLEELIDNLCEEMKRRHIERLKDGSYTLQNGFVFNDLITNFERVSDHCSNIAIAQIELQHDAFDTHDYLEQLRRRKDEDFDRWYDAYRAKYEL